MVDAAGTSNDKAHTVTLGKQLQIETGAVRKATTSLN